MEFVPGGNSNIFIREYRRNAGERGPGDHIHHFDHVTYCITGRIHVKGKLPDGRVMETTRGPGEWCLIKAEVLHEVTALEDGTLYQCIYAHRTPQGEQSQKYTGWPDAYG